MVTEREGKNIDNLENMGVSKFTYYLATYTATVILNIILGLFITILLKIFVLKYTNALLLFSVYISFSLVVNAFGLLLSTFFLST